VRIAAPRHSTGVHLQVRTLPASAVIERTEYALAGRFATIATIAEVTGQATVPARLSGRRAS
jgi:hypothetical protein